MRAEILRRRVAAAIAEESGDRVKPARLKHATQHIALRRASSAATTAIRSLDWDRSRFDIEFGLRNGTTYNSFLVRGERTALIDTSHLKFEGTWLPLLQEQIDPKAIDHLIVSHTEPDHSGLIGHLLTDVPGASQTLLLDAVTYANAYAKASVTDNLCGYSFATTNATTGVPEAAESSTGWLT